ncbi:probable cytochrome P450 9f2 [Musca vetustissima]|uniref:probable cytochrome P450 9f2 n=1 Tax=Musca vetustissima TaxID=27455 RepID=UPI002AB6F1FA|nr:probable cytochrome P450 9f2 [Musca vetustissima]
MWVEFAILLSVVVYLIYRWSTANYDFFEKRGIPYAKPVPMFGNFMEMVLRRKSMFDIFIEIYNKYDGKIYGIFDQRQPMFLVRDPDLVKQIAIKDFDHFVNHRSIFGEEEGKNLFAASLFMMKDSKWKDMRSTLSPAFTGSKMRSMFQLMNEVAQHTLAHVKKQPTVFTEQGLELEVKDFITRFTNDIIASTAFGLQVDSYKDMDNEFYKMGKKVTTFTFVQNLKFVMYANFKKIMKLLDIDLFDKKDTDYFMRLVLDAMKYRQEHNIIRPDMINMLMESRGMLKSHDNFKPTNREWTDVDIVGQCFLFFFAGFETSAALTCLTSHELMENPDVQEKLYEEIQEVEQQLEGKQLSYEALMGMRYMDMVVQECLRKWPGAIAIDRICNKDITYDLDDGTKLELKKGDGIWIPVVGFHHDPKYFENPEKFDPERFSEENKDKIHPFAYLPFGVGPRNCIGSRFALLETKVLIYYLLSEFKFEPAKKSCIPMKLNPAGFQLAPKDGFWIKFISRTK